MRNKLMPAMMFLAAVFAVLIYTGCKRATPVDVFIPCRMFGYYSANYTNYHTGSYIYSSIDTLTEAATITSISANIKGSNTAIVMIYDGSTGSLLAQSGQTAITDGWNTIIIPATALPAGSYRLAVMTINSSDSGIRSEENKGTRYANSNGWPNVPPTLTGGSAGSYALLLLGNYCQ